MRTRTWVVGGWNALSALAFARAARGFRSDISLSSAEETIDAKQNAQIATFRPKNGTDLILSISGPDEAEAFTLLAERLSELVTARGKDEAEENRRLVAALELYSEEEVETGWQDLRERLQPAAGTCETPQYLSEKDFEELAASANELDRLVAWACASSPEADLEIRGDMGVVVRSITGPKAREHLEVVRSYWKGRGTSARAYAGATTERSKGAEEQTALATAIWTKVALIRDVGHWPELWRQGHEDIATTGPWCPPLSKGKARSGLSKSGQKKQSLDKAARKRDRDSARQAVAEYRRVLVAYLSTQGISAETADEAAGETLDLLELLKAKGAFADASPVGLSLATAALVTAMLRAWKQGKPAAGTDALFKMLRPSSPKDSVSGRTAAHELMAYASGWRKTLSPYLLALKRDESRVIVMRLAHKQPYTKIAKALGVSQSTARSRFYRAARKLREMLESGSPAQAGQKPPSQPQE